MTGNELRRGSGSTVRWLILVHRYLGIPLSALFVVWFASGIVMMYTRDMPRLTPELRLERLPELDLDRIALAPAAAAGRAHLSPTPRSALLLTVLDRPAYRFDGVTVFADTGERLDAVGPTAATAVASRFTGRPREAVEYVGTLTEPDQWTPGRAERASAAQVRDRRRCRYRALRLATDGRGGDADHAAQPGAGLDRRDSALVLLHGAPREPAALVRRRRLDVDLGCLLAVIGLVLAVTQFRWRGPRGGTRSPAGRRARIPCAGWMRWHYLTGVVFGLVTLTWVFSGLLSMEPYAWTAARGLDVPRDALSGGPLDLARFPTFDAGAWGRIAGGRPVKEIELLRIQDDPYYAMRVGARSTDPRHVGAVRPQRSDGIQGNFDAGPLLVAADTFTVRDEPFGAESLLARLTAAVPGVPVVESVLLADFDSYYYARGSSRGRQAAVPVLRVKFGDPMQTWVYVDPVLSRVVAREHRFTRVERWLFNGLHSLDFAFWYDPRPLWDVGMVALSLGGLVSSGIGLWIGCGRIRRALGRRRPGRPAET